MMKIFISDAVVSRGYDGAPAIRLFNSENGGEFAVFQVGIRKYDSRAENNHRWVNLKVKAFGDLCERIKKMSLKEGSFISLCGDYDEERWTDKDTGRVTNVEEEDGEISTFYFTTTTGGQTGVRNNYLYSNGKLVQAEDGEGYQVFEVNGTLYLVNESGRVQDSNRTYRVDGEYRYEYDNGTIYYINDDRERLGQVTSGSRAPYIAFEAIYQLSGQTQ